jgi:hypothetical protein
LPRSIGCAPLEVDEFRIALDGGEAGIKGDPELINAATASSLD